MDQLSFLKENITQKKPLLGMMFVGRRQNFAPASREAACHDINTI